MKEKHTEGTLTWGFKYISQPWPDGEAAGYKLIAKHPSGKMQAEGSQWEHDARRLVACWNRLLPFTTEEIEAGIDLVNIVVQNKALVEALKEALDVIEDYLNYEYSGDPYEEDARQMGEMGINEYKRSGAFDKARALAKGAPK